MDPNLGAIWKGLCQPATNEPLSIERDFCVFDDRTALNSSVALITSPLRSNLAALAKWP
jgi:hypothetical protein